MNKAEVLGYIKQRFEETDEIWFSELVDKFCKSKGFEFFNDMADLKEIIEQLLKEKILKFSD